MIIESLSKSPNAFISTLSLLKFGFLGLNRNKNLMEAGSSNSSGQLSGLVVDRRGKHRIQAELKRLEQEARFLEEELEQLEKMENASASCKEFLDSVDSKPDPLLPETTGPMNATWDQWFERPKEAKRCGCTIL